MKSPNGENTRWPVSWIGRSTLSINEPAIRLPRDAQPVDREADGQPEARGAGVVHAETTVVAAPGQRSAPARCLRMTSMGAGPILVSMAHVSRTLADFLARATLADLPRSAIADTQRAILDWLGSAMAGSIEPPARMAQQVVARSRRVDEATVFRGGAIVRRGRGARERRRVAHPRARRHSQRLDGARRGAGDPRRAGGRRTRACRRTRVHARRRTRLRGGAAHRRSGESESLSSSGIRPEPPRRSARRLPPARCSASMPTRCSTHSAVPARRRPVSGSSMPTAR